MENSPLPQESRSSDEPFVEFGPLVGWHLVDLAELWRYRELFWFLAVRNVKVRYKQTVVGAAWAVIRPVATMALFAALFGLMKQTPTTGEFPYAITLYVALLPWQLFAAIVSQSSNSLVGDYNLIKKVYFPHIILPAAPILSALLDFAIAFGVLIAMMVFYSITPH